MATIQSTQVANRAAFPIVLNKTQYTAKRYVASFDATSLASGNIGDVIQACYVPKGAIMLGGRISWAAMTGGTQTLAIGDSGSATRFYPATAMGTSEGALSFGNVISQNLLYEFTAETLILLTNGTAAWSASKAFVGYIEFALT